MTDITLLDGGMGQELIKRSGKPATPLWATQALIDTPDLVARVHADYAEAGATVATTNTYAIHRDRLRGGDSNHYAAEGINLPDREGDFKKLIAAGCQATEGVRARARIAGSVGPLGGSYRPDLHPESAEAQKLFAEVVGLLAPHVDLILFETVASVRAARDALSAARARTDKPVWIAFTVDDEDGSLLRSGEAVAEAAKICQEADAVLANCSAPEAMPKALDALSRSGKPIGAYANAFTIITKDFIKGGTTATDLNAREDITADVYARHALSWLYQGATILGGCCETGPAHIAEIARRLKADGHRLI